MITRIRTFLKSKFRTLVSIPLLIGALGIGYFIYSVRELYASYEFHILIDMQKSAVLDFRGYRSVDWDEMAFLAPHGDICALGIKGYSKGTSDCLESANDPEAYVILLKNKRIAWKYQISRQKIDFKETGIPWPIPREHSVFLRDFNSNDSRYFVTKLAPPELYPKEPVRANFEGKIDETGEVRR